MEITGAKIIPQGIATVTGRDGVTATTTLTLYQPGEEPRALALPKHGDSQSIRPNGDGSYTVEDTVYSSARATTVTEYATSLSTEPIDTHPKFVSTLGGSLGAEKNSAHFNPDTGIFEHFLSDSKYAGVTSYLAFTATRTETTTRPGTTVDGTDGVGTVSGAFLCTAINSSVRAGIVTTRVEWRQAGPGGWNPIIYGS